MKELVKTTSAVLIPKRDNWRWVIRELTAGLDVEYWPQRRTASGNTLVGISSYRKSDIDKVLERAVEKLS